MSIFFMSKSRLESLSDGVFAIVFTLLVLDLKIPVISTGASGDLTAALLAQTPVFLAYIATFVVMSMFWVSHTFAYSMFVKNVNRQLALLNLVYLCCISLLPFSAHLIGLYWYMPSAVVLYGVHIAFIGLSSAVVFHYALTSHEIDTSHNSARLIAQVHVRQGVTIAFAVLGVCASLLLSPLIAFICYTFPILFNIIPGTLSLTEKLFGITLGKVDDEADGDDLPK
jgi:uncharacterized membrane protein